MIVLPFLPTSTLGHHWNEKYFHNEKLALNFSKCGWFNRRIITARGWGCMHASKYSKLSKIKFPVFHYIFSFMAINVNPLLELTCSNPSL